MTNPQGPPPQDPSMWARPGEYPPPTQPIQQAVPRSASGYPTTAEFPAGSPYGPPPQDVTAPPVKYNRRFQFRRPRFRGDAVSIVLVLVIVAALGIAGLIGGELYARHRANSVVAAATQCVVEDGVTASFEGSTPFLLQHVTGHYHDIHITTAGHNIRNAKGMKADININDVDLHGNAESKGTIGELDANITWTSAGIQETIQDSLPLIGGFVNSVTTNASAGTIELEGAMGLGAVTVKPAVADGALTLQVYKVSALGAMIPHETAQSALNTFTAALLKQYPLGIKADSVQVTNDGVVARFSSHNAQIPPGGQDPCFAHV